MGALSDLVCAARALAFITEEEDLGHSLAVCPTPPQNRQRLLLHWCVCSACVSFRLCRVYQRDRDSSSQSYSMSFPDLKTDSFWRYSWSLFWNCWKRIVGSTIYRVSFPKVANFALAEFILLVPNSVHR